jgi:hypothetical protein
MGKLRNILAEEGLSKESVRRLVRPARSYRLGQFVHVDGDAGGDYKGRVIKLIPRLTKPVAGHSEEERTEPGMIVAVDWWDGSWLEGRYRFDIQAWNSEAQPWKRTPGDRERETFRMGSVSASSSMKKHISALRRMFPRSARIDTTEAFGSGYGGIWTSFGEEGLANYQRSGYPDEFDPKLKKYMDRHGLYGSWYDPGTLMIYPA